MNRAVALLVASLPLVGCRDLSGFSTHGDSFSGGVTNTGVDLAGVDASTTLCLTLDTDHLQDAPGSIWTSDDRFHAVPMRPIPQIWSDPLSTLQFGLFDWYSPKFNHLHTHAEVRGWFEEHRFDQVTLTKPVLYSRWWEVLRYGECGGNIYMRGTRA